MIYTRNVRVSLPRLIRGVDNIQLFATTTICDGRPIFPKEGTSSGTVVELRDHETLYFEVRMQDHRLRHKIINGGVITAQEGQVRLNGEAIHPFFGRIRPVSRPSLFDARVSVSRSHKEAAAAYFSGK